MLDQHTLQQTVEPQALMELAVPREARSSGPIRICSDADAPDPEEQTLRLSLQISRANAPVANLPSMLVDTYYLQTVSSVMDRIRARRRQLSMAAAGAFFCGLLTMPLTTDLMRRLAEPATAPVPASSVLKKEEPAPRTPSAPMAAAPQAEPPHRTHLAPREAARQVHDARDLLESGRVREARQLLNEVLKLRSGFPPALAAMAELEIENGEPVAALRWARLATRALPSSIANWDLLGRACTAAGLHAESASAHAHATELYLRR